LRRGGLVTVDLNILPSHPACRFERVNLRAY
jgi:hypothetical protein